MENPSPSRNQFITDLNKHIEKWEVSSDDHLIIMLDANEFKGQHKQGLQRLIDKNCLQDVYVEHFNNDSETEEFPSHVNGSKGIDYILATESTIKS